MIHKFTCAKCKKEITHESDSTTGYGVNDKNEKICWACCGEEDKAYMIEHGKWGGYLTENKTGEGRRYKISNWPGSLVFEVRGYVHSVNNWGAKRTDVWFYGPDGKIWWGYHVGNSHECINVRRTKLTTI
jgi:hypothetical protein